MSLKIIFNVLAYVLLALMLLTGGAYIYSAFFEEPFLSYKGMPFHIQGPTYAGGPAEGIIQRCSSADSTRSYTTSRGFQRMGAGQAPTILPSIDATIEPGCGPATTRINVVPEGTPPGYYRFFGVAQVRGLFVNHEVRWDTDMFEVIPKPTKDAELVLHADDKNIKVEVLP